MRIKLFNSFLVFALAILANPAASQQHWVSLDSSGKLVYRTLAHGDHIVDFSYAGYMGGGVPLPSRIPIKRKLAPSGGDDTAEIQRAIDEISSNAYHEWNPGRYRTCARDISVQRSAQNRCLRGRPARRRPYCRRHDAQVDW